MKPSPIISISLAILLLAGCARPASISTPTPTLMPTAKPVCHKSGTINMDRVLFPDNGENHTIAVYLPPCYAENPDAVYPVLYWTNGSFWWQSLFDTTDRLIGLGEVPAFITVMVEIDPNKGFGADAQIVEAVVPFIDAHYRTQPDRIHRNITGISNGAAIAIRSAFRAPNLFSRVAVLSGGIANGEQEKFTNWIQSMLPDQRPEVLIDVGDQDGVRILSHYLMDLLDNLNYPYTFTHAPGDHTNEYIESHLADHLKWLMSGHQ